MREIRGEVSGAGNRFAVVASRFNEVVVDKLVAGALDGLRAHGVSEEDIVVVWVPGSFEIPVTARRLARSGRYAALICLGAVIRGETPHFDHVAEQAATGIRRAGEDQGLPVIFGVLTTDTFDQAMDRAGGKHGNKGWDAALAAIEMGSVFAQLGDPAAPGKDAR